MRYDVETHLPLQIDLLLQAYQKADVPSMERALDNINNIIKDKKFKNKITNYEIERQQNIKKIMDKTNQAIQEILKTEPDKLNELFIDIEEIKNDMLESLDHTERGYWNAIKEYITMYLNQIETEETDNEETHA